MKSSSVRKLIELNNKSSMKYAKNKMKLIILNVEFSSLSINWEIFGLMVIKLKI